LDTTRDTAIEPLEEDIVFGRLHPNERLAGDSRIARFGLKRHATRAALAKLERMGLVERRRNVGALVRLRREHIERSRALTWRRTGTGSRRGPSAPLTDPVRTPHAARQHRIRR
jgi:DNA-binding GntR family transcriptional regulator